MRKTILIAGLVVPWMAFAQNYPEDQDWGVLNNDNSRLGYIIRDQWGNNQGSMQGNGQGWDLYDRFGNKIETVDPR